MPDAALLSLVAGRLAAHPAPDRAAALVVAAFEGQEAVNAAMRGEGRAGAMQRERAARALPPAVYLTAIEVEGFRGVGEPATLAIDPGPGLTLVLGRNGSGKSSFSEALEMLVLGSNQRWKGRSKVWEEGWQNLHHRHTSVTARFTLDGRREPLVL